MFWIASSDEFYFSFNMESPQVIDLMNKNRNKKEQGNKAWNKTDAQSTKHLNSLVVIGWNEAAYLQWESFIMKYMYIPAVYNLLKK